MIAEACGPIKRLRRLQELRRDSVELALARRTSIFQTDIADIVMAP
jgi:hypothetical protein